MSVVTNRSPLIPILACVQRVERGNRKRERRWHRLKMRDLEWERHLIILQVWLLSFLFVRRMLVILLVDLRDVRRKSWKMEMDNGVVNDVIRAGIPLYIGILLIRMALMIGIS